MKKQPQAIIVSHVYSSDNKGDAALTSVLIQDIKRTFPKAAITILTLECKNGGGYFEHIPEKPSFMYYALNRYQNPISKLLYSIYMMSATLLWAIWYRASGKTLPLPKHLRVITQTYMHADLILPVGGGYIRSRKGLLNRWNIPLLLHPLIFGYLLGKPTILYSQSVGPFHGALESALVALTLRRMTLILLREDTSRALLADLGVTDNVVRAVDSGFLLASKHQVDLRQMYHIPADKLLVGVTVRSWLTDKAQAEYEKAVAETLDNLIQTKKAHVIFIPQVTAAKGDDDRLASRRVQARIHNQSAATVVESEPDHHAIKAMYDDLDLLLGTRFHSVIFSLTSYVPVLAIEYEHKTSGIMHDLQLGKWVVHIEDVTAKVLTQKMQELIADQDLYRKHLREHLPPYVLQAEKTIDVVAERYAATQGI